MKKVISLFAAVLALVAFASCTREVNVQSPEEGTVEVTFNIDVPQSVATKAVSDGTGATKLIFQVFDVNNKALPKLAQEVPVDASYKATIQTRLIKGVTYNFIFWAQTPDKYITLAQAQADGGKPSFTIPAETLVTMMNDDSFDAFYARLDDYYVAGPFATAVTLTRPFAQINVGAVDGDFDAAKDSEFAVDETLKTAYVLEVPNAFDLLNGVASGAASVDFTKNSHITSQKLTVENTDYDYVAMAYVLMDAPNAFNATTPVAEAKLTKDLVLNLATTQSGDAISLTRNVYNVPMQRNFRTNILGHVFSVEGQFTITVDANFQKDLNGKDHLPEYADIAALNAAFANAGAVDADKWSYKVKVLTAGDTKTIVLPKTLDPVDIYFAEGAFVNEDITISYADGAADDEKPYKLTIEAPLSGENTKSINKLVGNLPATTVVLAGTTTVDTADFHTASSTLHLMPKAKIINKLTVYAGSLLVEGFIETAVIDPSVAVNTVDAVAKVAEDGEVVRFIVQNLNAVIEEGAKVGELVVSTTSGYEGAAPVVTIEGGAKVETVEQKGDAKVVIDDDAKVDNVEAEDPSKITGDGAADVEFLIKNEAQLTAAVEAKVANMKIGESFTITRGYTIDFPTDINLNGFTISADATNTSAFPNSRAFKFAGTEAMNIKIHDGEIKLLDNKIYGPFRMENENGAYVLDNLTLNNKMAYGLGIKIVSAHSIALSNTTINSVVGGCIEQGTNCPMSITNCTFNQTELDTEHPWISAGVAVSYGGSLTVESGNYSAYRALYLYSSGGTINVSGGSFVGSDAVISVDNNTWEPGYAASSVINISDGSFDGPIFVNGWGKADPAPVAALNISGGTFTNSTNNTMFHASNGTISITGGTFSENPSAYVADGYIALKEGDVYNVIPGVLVSYDTEKTAKQNGTALYNAIMALPDGGSLYVAPGYYEWNNGESRMNWAPVNKSITIQGLGNPEDVTIATITGGRYGIVLQATEENVEVTIKNLTFTGAASNTGFLHPIYVKDYMTLNLENVICKSTTSNKYGLLLDSSNTHVKGVTTTVNAKNVSLDDGKFVGLMAKPRSDAYPEYGEDYVTYSKVYIQEGCNFTVANCEPQPGALSTGYNLLVNDVPFDRDPTLDSE